MFCCYTHPTDIDVHSTELLPSHPVSIFRPHHAPFLSLPHANVPHLPTPPPAITMFPCVVMTGPLQPVPLAQWPNRWRSRMRRMGCHQQPESRLECRALGPLSSRLKTF